VKYFPLFRTYLRKILVVAEYLAKGYKLSDDILQKAIDMDSKFLQLPVASAF